ncbi:NAD-dependent epimerase/dehydratase family protein [Neptunicella marina]|uniref:SDR family oxidoreductase n=1 Tax=Neptunicella marina TaxID=2125989 RepID=A0A8J6M3R1_9ALTE|nr:SDR family oxidoreductase [Neptunicella marina]MBC3765576.1 SDR family oxidoreductase [Neptunicella marina]
MKVFVTGTEGYIGTRMAAWLIQHGHQVTGLDTGFYRDGTLYLDNQQQPTLPFTLCKDLRHISADDLEGFDAVIHLAELSNDPLGEQNPDITFEINHQGSIQLAQAAKQAGVERFVYASSCSVYGAAVTDIVDEHSPVNPQTAYAKCKTLVERDLQPLADNDFSVVCLRNATAYGPSPRMRFDIVLNDLCALAFTTQKIAMISDGSPWRPIVHIEDICEAFRCALEAPAQSINGQIFNVGNSDENYRIREIAAIIAEVFTGCELSTGKPSGDNRSYKVSFDKIATQLPGYKTRWTTKAGAEELKQRFERIQMSADTYQFRAFTRLKQLNYLRQSGQLDDRLFWSQS